MTTINPTSYEHYNIPPLSISHALHMAVIPTRTQSFRELVSQFRLNTQFAAALPLQNRTAYLETLQTLLETMEVTISKMDNESEQTRCWCYFSQYTETLSQLQQHSNVANEHLAVPYKQREYTHVAQENRRRVFSQRLQPLTDRIKQMHPQWAIR